MAWETMALAQRLRTGISIIEARQIIARVRMRQGKYEEALEWFQKYWIKGDDMRADLDIALCFLRLRNIPMARQFYSDDMTLRFTHDKASDLPGTQSVRSLEASILLSRGLQYFLTSREREALEDFQAAGRLAPSNAKIFYLSARSLITLNSPTEAVAYLRKTGRGRSCREPRRTSQCLIALSR